MPRPARVVLAAGAALALADASIVTLALPALLNELDTTVEGVAAVIGVYTLVLALALPLAEWIRRRTSTRVVAALGFVVFAGASVACGVAPDLETLLAGRAAQAVGGAAGLVGAFAAIGAGRTEPSRLWAAASILAVAIGPALGGAVTQLFDWRAIFLAQAPIAALSAIAGALAARPARAAVNPGDAWPPREDESVRDESPARPGAFAAAPARLPLGPAMALALVSAALTGVLFLLVLLLIAGWSLEPLVAAVAVSVLPLAAVAGSRIKGDARTRAAGGSLLVGAGVLMLASVPGASVAWIVVPQALAGFGMGMSLDALAGGLLPERTAQEAARLLAVRHWGITIALVVLAPVTAGSLASAVDDARERSAAVVLDAKLDPREKLDLVGPITGALDPEDPRDALERSLDRVRPNFQDDDDSREGFDDMADRLDGTLVRAVDDAFRPAFVITGALALMAAALLAAQFVTGRRAVVRPSPVAAQTLAICAVAALALPLGQAFVAPSAAPARGEIRDPCDDRDLPGTDGLGGFLQDAGLTGLDRAACKFGSSREELALAIAVEEEKRAYERKYGVDPRSATDLLGGLLP